MNEIVHSESHIKKNWPLFGITPDIIQNHTRGVLKMLLEIDTLRTPDVMKMMTSRVLQMLSDFAI